MLDHLIKNYPHDAVCAGIKARHGISLTEYHIDHDSRCNCTRKEVIARARLHEAFLEAFTAHKNHPDAYSDSCETAYTEMISAYRRLL